MEPDELASQVMAAIRKAQSRYPQRLAVILADTVGEDDPAARHILAKAEESFPAPDEDVSEQDERMVFDDIEESRAPRPRPTPARRPGTRA